MNTIVLCFFVKDKPKRQAGNGMSSRRAKGKNFVRGIKKLELVIKLETYASMLRNNE
jgi:hypothetical protein